MTIITFTNIPKGRYGEIESYKDRINAHVILDDGRKAPIFSRLDGRELYDENNKPLNVEEIDVRINAPVREDYRQITNWAVRALKRFIIGEEKEE